VTDDINDKAQPLLEHLLELRNRLMWALGAFFIAFLVCFAFAKPLFNILVEPFTWAVDWAGLTDRKIELIYTAPQEFFFTQIKIGMFGGLVLAFPVIAAQLYKFIAPGLYRNERSAFLPYLVATPTPVPAGCRAGLFLLHSDGDVVLPVDGTDRRGGEASIHAVAEGVGVSRPDHDADLCLRHRVPASGGDHASARAGLATTEGPCKQAQIRDRGSHSSRRRS
jgi:hypothetical protein